MNFVAEACNTAADRDICTKVGVLVENRVTRLPNGQNSLATKLQMADNGQIENGYIGLPVIEPRTLQYYWYASARQVPGADLVIKIENEWQNGRLEVTIQR